MSQPHQPSPRTNSDHGSSWIKTDHNTYNIFRQYHGMFPTYDPENSAYFDQFSDSSTFSHVSDDCFHDRPWYGGFGSSLVEAIHQTYFAPFLNATTFHLMNWFYNSLSSKSLGDLDRLVNNVILADDFDRDDLQTFSAAREAKRLDDAHKCAESPVFSSADGWHETSIHITLNCESKPMEEAAAPKFAVEGLHYRKFTEVLKAAYREVAANTFHVAPFKLFWQPDEDEPPERIITELYTSDAMLQEHKNIKASRQESGC
ncbi:hypothetical protein PAXINDRAFT_94856, partial [Paxillus involutus ATCC 200175]